MNVQTLLAVEGSVEIAKQGSDIDAKLVVDERKTDQVKYAMYTILYYVNGIKCMHTNLH